MKKSLLYIATLLVAATLPFTLRAQQSADALLRDMGNAVGALGNYTVSFTLSAEGNTAAGEYTVSGDRYYLSMGDVEVYSDGRVRYEVNHSDDEVLIDLLDPSARDILSNPTKAFEFTGQAFSASYRGPVSISGKTYHTVDLVPTDRDSSIRNIELNIDAATNLPESISYAADGIDGYVIVKVARMAPAGHISDSLFTPDMSNFRGYEVIDFR